LANNTKDVANLVMIGTPNAGSPLAESCEVGTPAVYDLRPGAAATEVKMNPNTKYYTIAGEWDPKSGNCQHHYSHLWNNQTLLLFQSLMMAWYLYQA
jgi:hypothetical protein